MILGPVVQEKPFVWRNELWTRKKVPKRPRCHCERVFVWFWYRKILHKFGYTQQLGFMLKAVIIRIQGRVSESTCRHKSLFWVDGLLCVYIMSQVSSWKCTRLTLSFSWASAAKSSVATKFARELHEIGAIRSPSKSQRCCRLFCFWCARGHTKHW